jgi:GNAT superfamily N-acetyltransferase
VDKNEGLRGYAISHPILKGQPPAFDSLLGEIPSDDQEQQYYIHDVAILPSVRGRGLAAKCVRRLLEVAKLYKITCLISVYATESFWSRFGFVPGAAEDGLAEKLRAYGEDAKYLVRSNRQ